MKYGIDIGTTNSSISPISGRVVYAFRANTQQGIPTRIGNKNGDLVFGNECDVDPGMYIKDIKRRIRETGGKADVSIGGINLPIEKAFNLYMEYLVELINDDLIINQYPDTKGIEEITITAPASIGIDSTFAAAYNEFLRSNMEKITKLDPPKIHILEEPVAAAIYCLFDENQKATYQTDQTILVFDLGGGTLDIAIVKYHIDGTYEVLAKGGDLRLGGIEWDEVLFLDVVSDLNCGSLDKIESGLLKRDIEAAKIQLSTQDYASVPLVFPDRTLGTGSALITRKHFEEISTKLVSKSMDVLESVIKQWGGNRGDLDRVILVGGGSNMPMIEEAIKKRFDENKVFIKDPAFSISKGAALYNYLSKNVVDRASHTYGVDVTVENEPKILNLIYKGEKYDEKTKNISASYSGLIPAYPTNTHVRFNVYESDYYRKGNEKYMDVTNNAKANGLSVTVRVPWIYRREKRYRDFKLKVDLLLNIDGTMELTIYDQKGKELKKGRLGGVMIESEKE